MRALLTDLLTAIVARRCSRGEGARVRCPSSLDAAWRQAGASTLLSGAGGSGDDFVSVAGERRIRHDAVWTIRMRHQGIRDDATGSGVGSPGRLRAHFAVARPSFGSRRLLTTSELLLEQRR